MSRRTMHLGSEPSRRRTFGRTCAELAVAVAVTLSFTNGCGGTVLNDERHREDGGGTVSGGDSPGGSTPGGSTPGKPSAGTCGNGVVNAGESCDGSNLGAATCGTATMGLSSFGTLRCASDCRSFVTTGCTRPGAGAGGATGTGGYWGSAGGAIGRGGAGATVNAEAGLVSIECPPNTVLDPSGIPQCFTARTMRQDACYSWMKGRLPEALLTGPACGASCACSFCATEVTNCLASLPCANILRCQTANACTDVKNCRSCDGAMTANGGNDGPANQAALRAIACMGSAGCTLPCFPDSRDL